jgi:hypothetical protein
VISFEKQIGKRLRRIEEYEQFNGHFFLHQRLPILDHEKHCQ